MLLVCLLETLLTGDWANAFTKEHDVLEKGGGKAIKQNIFFRIRFFVPGLIQNILLVSSYFIIMTVVKVRSIIIPY